MFYLRFNFRGFRWFFLKLSNQILDSKHETEEKGYTLRLNQTWQVKILYTWGFLVGKSLINGGFSSAMFDYWKVLEAGWWFQTFGLFSISYMGFHPSH